MSAATYAPDTLTTPDARITPRAHLRHTSALIRRNLLWISAFCRDRDEPVFRNLRW